MRGEGETEHTGDTSLIHQFILKGLEKVLVDFDGTLGEIETFDDDFVDE